MGVAWGYGRIYSLRVEQYIPLEYIIRYTHAPAHYIITILSRRSLKFGSMEIQSGIFSTILASGNTSYNRILSAIFSVFWQKIEISSCKKKEKWQLIDQSNSWKVFVYLFFSTFAEACAALHRPEKSLLWTNTQSQLQLKILVMVLD